jgi:4-amino-4-deoxy-L-arabinose transferase-like glycosyltransferase
MIGFATNAETQPHRSPWTSDTALLLYIAAATVIAHIVTGGQYGFHRDELATLDDARHLAWGYIAYPPVTPFFGRLSLILFGTSLAGFRFFAALAEAAAVVVTGLMAREFGGRRGAQLVAAAAAIPFCLAGGALMQYVSFDYLCWVLVAYFFARMLRSEDSRWWLAIGAAIGFGFLSKYSMAFCVAGLAVGVLATDARRFLRSKWLWYGAALALLIFAPNLVWQAQHHFVSIEFLRTIHARDVRIGRTANFLPYQLTVMLLALPLCVVGLWFLFFDNCGRRFRGLGWMYIVPFILFVVAKGRGYYLAPAYPILYAAGSVWGERWLATVRLNWSRAIRIAARTVLSLDAVFAAALTLPIAPINSAFFRKVVPINGDYRDEIGWPELMQTLAQIRNSLPPEERARTVVLAGNYGEAGAVNLLGPAYGLPPAISGGNSFWAHGYGDPPPETVIIVGMSRRFADHYFNSCQLAAKIWNTYNVENEETRDHPEIFVCRDLKESWPEFWRNFQYFG